MSTTVIVRSRRGMWGTIVIVIICAVLAVAVFAQDGLIDGLQLLPWLLLLANGTYWMWNWPALTIAPSGLTIRNMVRTIRIPWSQLTGTESRFGLYLHTDRHRYFVSAAPARRKRITRRSEQSHAWTPSSSESPTDSPDRADMDAAAAERLINEQLQAHRESSQRTHQLEPQSDGPAPTEDQSHTIAFSITWNWPPMVVMAAVVALAIASAASL